MSHMKQSLIEDDGFVTEYPRSRFTLRQRRDSLLGEFGSLLGNDVDVSNNGAEKLFKAAVEFLDDVVHPPECPRNRDDHNCNCSIGLLAQDMQDWLSHKAARHWPANFEF